MRSVPSGKNYRRKTRKGSKLYCHKRRGGMNLRWKLENGYRPTSDKSSEPPKPPKGGSSIQDE